MLFILLVAIVLDSYLRGLYEINRNKRKKEFMKRQTEWIFRGKICKKKMMGRARC